ncbi:response regulator [Bdellovibrio sp. SKB1291214]|uniref:response regulator n=1 Tax=Bdellovibrio sp. SKB1291214 TaxID=1732569 RepID=UPI0020CF3894|nr:response regulator [Bdellovibrio sp. SKB1291214]UYL07487.1 response regulator [Bdellovibrio sp. SKB1291214]
MALRVLLADESSTIKKVMQLALSDFAVEVKAVPVGLDVLPVTKSFKPDIIFADVLLTKRNGYEVSLELKNDPETSNIPVVLMWSGFMEIDEGKVTESRADDRLEKPFDAEHLRGLVNKLVKKTSENPVSQYLTFPEMPEFEEMPNETPAADQSAAEVAYADPELNTLDSIPEISEDEALSLDIPGEEFTSVPLTSPKGEDEMDEGGWAHQDLTKFKLNIPQNETEDFASKFVIPQDEDLSNAHIEVSGNFEEISFDEASPDLTQKPAPVAAKAPPKTLPEDSFLGKVEKSVKDQMMETLNKGPSAPKAQPTAAGAKPTPANAQGKTQSKVDLSSEMMEKIVREEAREVIESVCWKLLPEIAERIVREELSKLMRETEKSI